MTSSKLSPILKGILRSLSSEPQLSFSKVLKTTLSQPSNLGFMCMAMSPCSVASQRRLMTNLQERNDTRGAVSGGKTRLESNWNKASEKKCHHAGSSHATFILFLKKPALRPQIFYFDKEESHSIRIGLCVSSRWTFNSVKKAAPPRLRLLKVFSLFATNVQNTTWLFLYSHGDVLRN